MVWPLYRIDGRKEGKQLVMNVCVDEDDGSSEEGSHTKAILRVLMRIKIVWNGITS